MALLPWRGQVPCGRARCSNGADAQVNGAYLCSVHVLEATRANASAQPLSLPPLPYEEAIRAFCARHGIAWVPSKEAASFCSGGGQWTRLQFSYGGLYGVSSIVPNVQQRLLLAHRRLAFLQLNMVATYTCHGSPVLDFELRAQCRHNPALETTAACEAMLRGWDWNDAALTDEQIAIAWDAVARAEMK